MIAAAVMPLFLGHVDIAANDVSGQTSLLSWFDHSISQFKSGSTFFFNVTMMALLLLEAFLLNRIVAEFKLVEKSGFLPGFGFLLLNLLAPTVISAKLLLTNGLILMALKLLIGTYKVERPNNGILVTGFMLGLINAIDSRYFLMFVWLISALLIMRPASLREIILAIIGYTLPFYFIGAFLYLTDGFSTGRIMAFFDLNFNLPKNSGLDWARTILMVMLPWLGFVSSSNRISKLLIQGRKSILITLSLLLALHIILALDMADLSGNLQSAMVPSALMLTYFFTSFKKQFLPNLLILLMAILSCVR